jgi:hypothetical protein
MKDLTPWQKYKQNLGNTRPWDLITERNNLLSEEESNKRFDICKVCPELIALTSQCKKCGCFMSAKTKLPKAVCPIGKW